MTTSPPVTGTPPSHLTAATGQPSTDPAPHHLCLVPPAAPGAVDGPPDPEAILDEDEWESVRRARRWRWPALACVALPLPGIVACLRTGLPLGVVLLAVPPMVVLLALASWGRADDHTLMTLDATGRIRALRFEDVTDAWVSSGYVFVRDRYGTAIAPGPHLSPPAWERVRQALVRRQAQDGRPLNRAAAEALGLPVLPGARRGHWLPRVRLVVVTLAMLPVLFALAWLGGRA